VKRNKGATPSESLTVLAKAEERKKRGLDGREEERQSDGEKRET